LWSYFLISFDSIKTFMTQRAGVLVREAAGPQGPPLVALWLDGRLAEMDRPSPLASAGAR
jgi:hypothetical protein